jgi:chlorobactene glucosyltransferase
VKVIARVSVLIPARNEAERIGKTLESLLLLSPSPFEIIVLDDNSEDNTREILQVFAQKSSLVKILDGRPLPVGWLGKNFACHQLAQAAEGDYLLFIDADVHLSGNILERLLLHFERQNLDFLSVFPRQEMSSAGEETVVPMMYFLLLSLLPLPLVRRKNHHSLAAANGQMMFFESSVYKRVSPHERVKNKVTEDIETAKLLKSEGYKIDVLLGDEEAECKMYGSLEEAMQGFTKNFYAGFGFNPVFLMGFLFVIGIGQIFSAWEFPLLLPVLLVLTLLHQYFLSRLAKTAYSVFLVWHIPRIFLFHVLAFRSVRAHWLKGNFWKGRRI